MLRVIKNFAKSLSLSRSLGVVPFKSLDTVSYSHSIVTVVVSLAVRQYKHKRDRHTARQTDTALCIASRGKSYV